jgi:dihydroorotase
MAKTTLIKNARIVNENRVVDADVRLTDQRITQIASELTVVDNEVIFDANGSYLLPGMIDDQVHFREPGLTHKGNIASESRAAVAGGITSYMEMPNVNPATTSIKALEAKYDVAEKNSMANYAFYLGATEDNLEQIKSLDPSKHCGVKVFMGASTGSLLVEDPRALENIFRESPVLIVTHCESGAVIANNLAKYKQAGKTAAIFDHSIIRDTQACYDSSSYAVSLAKQFNSQLHVLHITSEKELSLFTSGPIEKKQITAEACAHHLWFCDDDYSQLGHLIKCNPSIKAASDRAALLAAVRNNIIDIIATDHAPHTLLEKQQDYNKAPAGLPLVQHALLSLFDHVKHGRLSISQLVAKTAHNPAKRYGVVDRGFIREGYFADLVVVNPSQPQLISHVDCLYQCGWTPFVNHQFTATIESTWVNGKQVFNRGEVIEQPLPSQRLVFKR